MHQRGIAKTFEHRLKLTPQQYLMENLGQLLKSTHLPDHFKKSYEVLIGQIHNISEPIFSSLHLQRIHGDFHLGNVIKREEKYFMVDFDDSVTGPKEQDIWLLLPSPHDETYEQSKNSLLSGYSLMNDKPLNNLAIIPYLRIFRQFHFTAWIAKRWDDPIFPKYFPQFATDKYFEQQIADLKLALGTFQSY